MNDDLIRLRDAVIDEGSFLIFLQALAEDRADEVEKETKSSSSHAPSTSGWENGTIEDFLESAVAWAKASKDGTAFYSKPINPWKRCADIIFMGRIYE